MLDHKAFTSISNILEIGRKNYPIIITGRKPTCWKCGVIGHLIPSCPEKKASGGLPKFGLSAETVCSCNVPVCGRHWWLKGFDWVSSRAHITCSKESGRYTGMSGHV